MNKLSVSEMGMSTRNNKKNYSFALRLLKNDYKRKFGKNLNNGFITRNILNKYMNNVGSTSKMNQFLININRRINTKNYNFALRLLKNDYKRKFGKNLNNGFITKNILNKYMNNVGSTSKMNQFLININRRINTGFRKNKDQGQAGVHNNFIR